MKNKIAAVHKFHTAFKLNIQDTPTVAIAEDRKKLRFELMKEENEEYLEAAENNDLSRGCRRFRRYVIHSLWHDYRARNAGQN